MLGIFRSQESGNILEEDYIWNYDYPLVIIFTSVKTEMWMKYHYMQQWRGNEKGVRLEARTDLFQSTGLMQVGTRWQHFWQCWLLKSLLTPSQNLELCVLPKPDIWPFLTQSIAGKCQQPEQILLHVPGKSLMKHPYDSVENLVRWFCFLEITDVLAIH